MRQAVALHAWIWANWSPIWQRLATGSKGGATTAGAELIGIGRQIAQDGEFLSWLLWIGIPDRGRQYVVTTRTPPLGSRECRSGPASASNASISASPLTIGKPHSIILHELPRLGIRLRV